MLVLLIAVHCEAQNSGAPLFREWAATDLGEAPPWFEFGPESISGTTEFFPVPQQASFTGLVGNRVPDPPSEDPSFRFVPIFFDVIQQEWFVLTATEDGATIPSITANGRAVADSDTRPVIFDHRTGEAITLSDSLRGEVLAINEQGHLAMELSVPPMDGHIGIIPQQITFAPPDGYFALEARDISEADHIIGRARTFIDDELFFHGFYWEPQAGLSILDPRDYGYENAEIHAVNDNGVAVGRFDDRVTSEIPLSQTFFWDTQRLSILREGGFDVMDINNHDGVLTYDGRILIDDQTYILTTPVPATRRMAMHLTDEWAAIGIVRQENDVFDPDAEFNHHYHLVSWNLARIAGDYDGNGFVDQGDLDLVLMHWGTRPDDETWVNHQAVGIVDQAELDYVLLQWGISDGFPEMPTVDAGATAIPEPGEIYVALVAFLAICPLVRVTRSRTPARHRLLGSWYRTEPLRR